MNCSIGTVGVAGAGLVGAGVALCLAEAGLTVILYDHQQQAWNRAQKEIKSAINLMRMLQKSSVRAQDVLPRISFTSELGDMSASDFVIESISENCAAKRELLGQLDKVCPNQTVFASTTSAIPITRLASFTNRPEYFIGLHFMNPVPLKPMVEMIKGLHTSQAAIEAAQGLLERCGKKWILVYDSPGFVSNRVLMLTVNEAIWLLQDGVAEAKDIDAIFKGCIGHKMGPLETADMIGLDTILYSLQVLQESFGDTKYRPCPLLRQMVDGGLLGRKSGKGFFTYPGSVG